MSDWLNPRNNGQSTPKRSLISKTEYLCWQCAFCARLSLVYSKTITTLPPPPPPPPSPKQQLSVLRLLTTWTRSFVWVARSSNPVTPIPFTAMLQLHAWHIRSIKPSETTTSVGKGRIFGAHSSCRQKIPRHPSGLLRLVYAWPLRWTKKVM